jgi:hypothetical protein
MSLRQNSYSRWVAAREEMAALRRRVDAALPGFQRARRRERADLTDDEAMALAVEAQHASRPRPH